MEAGEAGADGGAGDAGADAGDSTSCCVIRFSAAAFPPFGLLDFLVKVSVETIIFFLGGMMNFRCGHW